MMVVKYNGMKGMESHGDDGTAQRRRTNTRWPKNMRQSALVGSYDGHQPWRGACRPEFYGSMKGMRLAPSHTVG